MALAISLEISTTVFLFNLRLVVRRIVEEPTTRIAYTIICAARQDEMAVSIRLQSSTNQMQCLPAKSSQHAVTHPRRTEIEIYQEHKEVYSHVLSTLG